MSGLDATGELALQDVEETGQSAWRAIWGSHEGRAGLVIAGLVLGLVVFGRFLAPYSPTEIAVGPSVAGPSREHLLGTDDLGRDVFSRVLTGGDSIILVPLLAALVSLVVGGGLGMLGGYLGGSTDAAITRVFDLMLILPALLLVLMLIAAFGSSTPVLVLTIGLVFVPRMGRIVRGATQAVVANDYISAAQARGERAPSILTREVLPNITGPTIADFALRVTYGVIFVATLSFLGLGTQPPAPDWGSMIAESRSFIVVNPWATLGPVICIAALSVAFNLIADVFTGHLARAPASQGTSL
jgi:peptide/nickel transport system permease protein